MTGSDVIHSWTIPAFGVKQDAVPGRLAELWFAVDEYGRRLLWPMFRALRPGPRLHANAVKAVSPEAYKEWLAGAIDECWRSNDPASRQSGVQLNDRARSIRPKAKQPKARMMRALAITLPC